MYWFRTPPGVRVGRSAIDEDAIRLLEAHNPEVQFDWPRILREPPPQPPAPRKEERRGRDRDRRAASRDARPSADRPPEPAATATATATATEYTERGTATEYTEYTERGRATEYTEYTEHGKATEDTEDTEQGVTDHAESIERRVGRDGAERAAAEHLEREENESQSIERERADVPGLDPLDPEPRETAEHREPVCAAEARLGAEGLARLRGRYAEVMARIAERPLDEDAREELKRRAERLNPDTWVTADEVSQGLEVYEAVYEGLRAVVGTRHRRHRRSRDRRGNAEE